MIWQFSFFNQRTKHKKQIVDKSWLTTKIRNNNNNNETNNSFHI